MSNQVGDCFKILWPFQNVRTLMDLLSGMEISSSPGWKIPQKLAQGKEVHVR